MHPWVHITLQDASAAAWIHRYYLAPFLEHGMTWGLILITTVIKISLHEWSFSAYWVFPESRLSEYRERFPQWLEVLLRGKLFSKPVKEPRCQLLTLQENRIKLLGLSILLRCLLLLSLPFTTKHFFSVTFMWGLVISHISGSIWKWCFIPEFKQIKGCRHSLCSAMHPVHE